MAERVGFEPTVDLRLRLISSQVHSTTLPPLRRRAFYIKGWPIAMRCRVAQWPSVRGLRMRLALFGILLSLLAACGPKPLPAPTEQSVLVVVTRDGPTTQQLDASGKVIGFEHDLITLFAEEIGTPVQFLSAADPNDIATALKQGRAHFGAGGLAPLPDDALRYTRPFRELNQVLVQHEDTAPVDEVADLAGKTVEALAGSAELAALYALTPKPEGLRIVAVEGMNEIQLLERVAKRQTDLAATDSAHFDIGTNFFPALQEAFTLPGKRPIVWAFPKDGDPALLQRADAFLQRVRSDGTMARLIDRYFGHVRRLNRTDVAHFLESTHAVLPRYRRDFIDGQEELDIDWRLLAALAYQESHWDPLATSPTNVRGMMMLTADTADRLHVPDRLDARQSILAGSRYLVELREQLPAEVKEPDRTWLALAAYNLGMGHMNGARAIAQMVKRDPNSWYEMKQVLPLLAQPQYASHLKSGAARGGEAVIMVENIRTYYDILVRYEKALVASPVVPSLGDSAPLSSPQALPINSMPPM